MLSLRDEALRKDKNTASINQRRLCNQLTEQVDSAKMNRVLQLGEGDYVHLATEWLKTQISDLSDVQ